MGKKWDKSEVEKAKKMRSENKTYAEIALALGRTLTGVKHKIRRLQQSKNLDRYKHTAEKTGQIVKYLKPGSNVLETHCGFGGLTRFYADNDCFVDAYDIKQKRVDAVNSIGYERVHATRANSEEEILALLYSKIHYDVIDIDPYGFPSRYFPLVFGLINDGVMFLTFPIMGVAQINKITIRHYLAFWGITLSDKENYVRKIFERLEEYAFMQKREIKLLDCIKIDRVYRLAISVKKKSLVDIVGLKINKPERKNEVS
jgi:tRNA G26 N,N-dimethylase Trm1